MRKFSRWMPPAANPPMTLAGWFVLVGLAAAAVAAIVAWPNAMGLGIVALLIFVLVGTYAGNRRLRRLAAERAGEDIGTFARAFDRRAEPFDPWVVRATWDALQPYVTFRGGRVPLRPTDRLVDDLCIDPDDIDFDLVKEVAERSGRSLDQPETNPYYGRVDTVGDFVRFISCQRRAAARRDANEPGTARDGGRAATPGSAP
jgi:hypothetical protein